jgi:undecaprenyl-diphosphatase
MARSSVASVATGVLFIIGLVVFGYFASTVESFPGEARSSTWVQSWRTSWLDTAMKAVSWPGALPVAAPIVLALSIGAYARGWRAEAVLILKEMIARPRPTDSVVQVLQETSGYSFPSGHAMHHAVLFGIVLVVLTGRMGPRAVVWTAGVALTIALLVMGISRMYLGMHWLGDVVGGYAFGAAVVMVAMWVWGSWRGRHAVKDADPPVR